MSAVQAKRAELDYLRKITALTDTLKSQLDELSVQVSQMNNNASVVEQIMENWNSILRSISQASLSLHNYSQGDYQVGAWNENDDTKDENPPLPGTLLRMRVDGDTTNVD
ncbi:hypothetical protein Kpol_1018p78 [Vanderwaltozyma polyspora DSM 70294]|uniref:DASH complex subunit DAD2 n=1 Tax=Vanderwaltozyma polyspora (strain ATCC 22028 / DSM 70294 / BCRC 21397 / CBS 2163 / NBRC 10782 / NRRL Y-8283 / UCD 57-17) TaxID=436907 RepID=A7TDS6_VANPO|nr:uncharacterized protein Kpol_1018p78 [Vanderwaltozyma polyspora DSM 70294]EDO19546.1 hypothetical protein Kpol_1018p78 [Vanderwaltozyma polyspora DSM 70294]